jgi:calcium/calmodulin-dependent protein kinase I
MAPEVALKKEYSRSVDIWSIGIIMYMLLTGGSHPIYASRDNPETYKQKLRKIN